MLYMRAALNAPSGHLLLSHKFSKGNGGKISKYIETKFRFVSNHFFSMVKFCFVSFQTVFSTVKFHFVCFAPVKFVSNSNTPSHNQI